MKLVPCLRPGKLSGSGWHSFVFQFADDFRDAYKKKANEIPAEGNC